MKRSRIRRQLLAVVSLALLVWADAALAVRVKDIAALRGARDNQLIGFGIVWIAMRQKRVCPPTG